ncbi:hypothetical protein LH464_21310 [Neorhizobium sp. T786]|uniref:hypothetical protein n=1 Tax=Pseudorhizobium xiangyangii TaxID=2883104 RepID=UPI001CFFF3E3|nr:hypothetical protein [Neorhizobium xiangyangii]MCB5205008.1 hypothetical protein [Neorhizobium xiangyangii]
MGFLSGLMGADVGKNQLKSLKKNQGLIDTFRGQGNEIINTGEGQSAGAINSAIGGYQPWVDAGEGALGTYQDALGLNGAEGNARATGAFQVGPGYQFAMGQGEQAALRGASAAGMLSSGNTLTALTEYGQGMANQEYGGWLDRLNGLSGQGMQGAAGQAQGYGGLADLYQTGTGNRLSLESEVLGGTMDINNNTAQIKDQQAANKSSFFGGLIGKGLGLATKAATGGLF